MFYTSAALSVRYKTAIIKTQEKQKGEIFLNLKSPQLSDPLEKSDLLYDLVQLQLTDEEEICSSRYLNQTLEDYEASCIEFKNCIFHNCHFLNCRIQNLSFTDVILENCDLSACHFEDLAAQRVIFKGCKLMGSFSAILCCKTPLFLAAICVIPYGMTVDSNRFFLTAAVLPKAISVKEN